MENHSGVGSVKKHDTEMLSVVLFVESSLLMVIVATPVVVYMYILLAGVLLISLSIYLDSKKDAEV